MHKTQKREIVENALHQACAYIQNQLGVKTGDTAGVFFCGQHEDTIHELFEQYLELEISYQLPQLHRNEDNKDMGEMYGLFSFECDCVDVSNFIVSDCSRFNASPEKYGFELVNTGDQSMAHSKDFMLNGTPVTLVLTDKNRAGKAITKDTVYALVTMYHTDTVDEITSYVISR
jgi:hypothetical protein